MFNCSLPWNNIQWWSDLKTSIILLLQNEQKQMVEKSRQKTKNLQDRYRTLAMNPSSVDLIEMYGIRGSIRQLLVEKATANRHGYHERNVQTLGEIAQARLSSTRSNQSVIQFLNHPVKGRVDQIEDMLDVTSTFYDELYPEKPIEIS